jgi:hypothetical protein
VSGPSVAFWRMLSVYIVVLLPMEQIS